MATDPLVSIVTPSFNQGCFLRRAIDSVLHQDYPHIEYLVMDGGSTDESVSILQSYGNRFGWVSEPDCGQSHALNKGFARCRGTLRAYLNSDDVLLPGAVRTAVDYFRQHPDWDLIYGEAHLIDRDDRVIGRYDTADYSFDRLMVNCCICQPAAFWRSRIADRVGPFNESLHCVLDYEYWLRIDRAGGRLVHLPDLLACSRIYPETKTQSLRLKGYREAIAVSRTQGGYVELSVVRALWQYLCFERGHGLPWRLRRVPLFPGLMARLHRLWCNLVG
jgi:glycosyltransferase involved in cell wall biosynthesis